MTTVVDRALTALLVATVWTSVAEGQSLIPNGEFNTDVAGWSLSGGGPESVITWDGTNGFSSPGSLEISSTLVPAQGTVLEALSDCVNTIPGEIIDVSGWMMEPTAQFGTTCFVTLVLYDGPDCTGNRTITGNVPPNTPGVWEESGFAINIPAADLSVRASLSMALNRPDPGEKICLFDTVSMTSDSRGVPMMDVPALSWTGLLFLGLFIAFAATILINRRPSKQWP